MQWLGPTPAMRMERHYGSRLLRCFAERPESVSAMLADAVIRRPHGEALVCEGLRLDYRGLDHAVGCTAAGLARLGLGLGDRIALLLPNSAEMVVALLAIMRMGAIVVPLNVREGPRELGFVLAGSGARALLYDEALSVSLPSRAETPDLVHRLAIELSSPGAGLRGVQESEPLAPYPSAEQDIAAILYTSGTTGRPKGAMLTHLGIVHAAMIYEAAMGIGAHDRSVVSVPLTHVTGLTAGIALMLKAAGGLIVMPSFKADAFLALAAREGMTHTVMVPAMYNLCLLSPAFASADLAAWRVGGYGGAPMPSATIARLAERLPGLRLFNAYGSTETTGPVVLMPPDESRGRAGQVGRAVPSADILVMNEAGHELPAGQSGEIWLKGPNVVPGYWNDAQATAEAFVEGFWRSGDVGALDADGFLTLLDRAKDMVNRGGFKIYSVEVENVLAGHESVVEAAIVARPCPVLGERVHAFVVASSGFCDDGALRAFAAARLADFKVPESIDFLDAPLPRNAAGKVLKRELRERLARDPSPGGGGH
ncbi:MAG: class I adenylate-forming enzyme family protein [Hyphomicrobiaceae bacterium]